MATPHAYKEVQYTIRLEMTAPLLGAVPLNETIYADFKMKQSLERAQEAHKRALTAASNGHIPPPVTTSTGDPYNFVEAERQVYAPDPEGLSSRSGFLRDEKGNALVGSHVIKGFLKESARARAKQGGAIGKVPAYIQLLTLHCFIKPNFIKIDQTNADKSVTVWNERPLRAETAQGPRVALKSSEQIGTGAILNFTVTVLAPHLLTEDILHELFSYGQWHGLGEWRNNGALGTFDYSINAK